MLTVLGVQTKVSAEQDIFPNKEYTRNLTNNYHFVINVDSSYYSLTSAYNPKQTGYFDVKPEIKNNRVYFLLD